VTIVVNGGEREVLSVSFIDDGAEPYQIIRTIHGEKGSTVVIYNVDGSEQTRGFVPKRQ
jgi:hypothetical protein